MNSQKMRTFVTSVWASRNRLVMNKPISGWVPKMACDSLLTDCKLSTDLLQVDSQNLLSTDIVKTSCFNKL